MPLFPCRASAVAGHRMRPISSSARKGKLAKELVVEQGSFLGNKCRSRLPGELQEVGGQLV